MDDFEQAIHVVFSQDPSITPAVREQATAYCDAVKSRPDCFRFCWEHFSKRDSLEVKFWCLQALPATLPTLPPEGRGELRARVLDWLRDVAAHKQEDVMVRNKIALVYVGLLAWDYPAQWPTAWSDVMALLEKGPNLVDMFLRILATFDQEVISDEVPRSQEERQRTQTIKQAMREADVGRLAECWYAILSTFRQSAPHLVVECLKAIGAFIVWVEISTVANDRFLGAICGIVQEAGPAAGEACDCFGAVLEKKMPAQKKILMLEQLQILKRLEGCVHRGSSDVALVEKEAELFNTVGEVALEAYAEIRVQQGPECASLAQAAWSFIKDITVFIFWFFSHQECQVADSVEPFLTALFAKVKGFVRDAEVDLPPDEPGPCHNVDLDQVRPILQQTLQMIIQRLAYPDWFQHGDPNYEDDERHIAFLEFRRSLTKIFKRIFLIDEQMGFMFVQASVSQMTQNLSSVRPMEVEAVLHLFKETGEIVKDLNPHLQANGALSAPFVQLVSCDSLVQAEHWLVQLGLLDLYVRFGKIFALRPELFPSCGQRVLQAFVGAQGIRSHDRRVVARACYMFSRFIKLAKDQILPFAGDIYEALKDTLAIPFIPSSLLQAAQAEGSVPRSASAPPSAPQILVNGSLKLEDQAAIFEALAGLAAAMPPEQLRPALQRMLEGPAANLAELLNADLPRLASDPQGYSSWAARSIEAISMVSKPFSHRQDSALKDWVATLGLISRTLDRCSGQFSGDASLWRATLFLSRRMVEVLSDLFLPVLDELMPFFYSSSQADLLELTSFAHQSVCFYQKRMQPFLQKWLHVLFLRPVEVWKQMPEQSEQLRREKFELGSAVLQLLKEIAQRCPAVLLEPMLGATQPQLQSQQPGAVSGGLGQELVAFLLATLSDPRELKAVLYASSTWSALLEAAVCPGSSPEALAALPLAQLLQQLLWSMVRLELSDIQAQKIMGEVAAVLRTLTSARALPEAMRAQSMEAVKQAVVAAMPGLRGDAAPRQLLEALAHDAPLREIRASLQRCATEWRRDCGAA